MLYVCAFQIAYKYFLLPWKIPGETGRQSILVNLLKAVLLVSTISTYVDATFYHLDTPFLQVQQNESHVGPGQKLLT